MDYYKQPSNLGLPILKILIDNPRGECRHTLYQLERERGWGFNLCSAAKYLWRLGDKDDTISDLDKSIAYLGWELENPIAEAPVGNYESVQMALIACQSLRFRLTEGACAIKFAET